MVESDPGAKRYAKAEAAGMTEAFADDLAPESPCSRTRTSLIGVRVGGMARS